MKNLLSQYSLPEMKKGKISAGLEIIGQDDAFLFNLVVLRKNKEQLEVLEKHTGLDSIELVKKYLPLAVPVNLIIGGKGVIHKLVGNEYVIDKERLVQAVMPNADATDFYVDHVDAAQNQTLISLIRKERFEDTIQLLSDHGYFVVSASLGPFGIISMLVNLLGRKKDDSENIHLSEHKITCEGEMIVNIEKKPGTQQSYQVGGEDLDNNSTSAFTIALKYLVSDLETLPTLAPEILRQRGEFISKRLFHYSGIAMMVFFLLILLFNTVAFTHYSEEFSDLDRTSGAIIMKAQLLEEMEKELERKSMLLASTGLSEAPRTSLHADRIAQTVPQDIELSILNIGPLEKRITQDHIPVFRRDQITVAGKCKRTTDLDSWVRELQGYSWVKGASVTDFSGLGKGTSGEFVIMLTL